MNTMFGLSCANAVDEAMSSKLAGISIHLRTILLLICSSVMLGNSSASYVSALGHRRPLRSLPSERLLPRVKRSFPSRWIDGILSLNPECPFFSKADVQRPQNPPFLRSAFGQERTCVNGFSEGIQELSHSSIPTLLDSCISRWSGWMQSDESQNAGYLRLMYFRTNWVRYATKESGR